MLVAIDGPAGAGKSTVARALAARLGFAYLDSGAMYRCVGLLSLRAPGVAPDELARGARIELGADPGGRSTAAADPSGAPSPRADPPGAPPLGADPPGAPSNTWVRLDGCHVSEEIRAPEVSAAASRVAANPEVRAALVAKQRELIASGDWVAEGRDIGTVVAPDAELKVFLTAAPEERARRRAAELGADRDTVLAEQTLRDERDRTRAHSPLAAAPGAVVLDTSGATVEQVEERIAALARAASASV